MCRYAAGTGNSKLTLVVVILVVGRPVKHAEDLEDVAVAVVAVELVAGAVEAQDQLTGAPGPGGLNGARWMARGPVLGGERSLGLLIPRRGGRYPRRVGVEVRVVHDGCSSRAGRPLGLVRVACGTKGKRTDG